MDYRKSTSLCLRCSNAGHRVVKYPLLPPQRPIDLRANVNTAKAATEDLGGLEEPKVEDNSDNLGKE